MKFIIQTSQLIKNFNKNFHKIICNFKSNKNNLYPKPVLFPTRVIINKPKKITKL